MGLADQETPECWGLGDPQSRTWLTLIDRAGGALNQLP